MGGPHDPPERESTAEGASPSTRSMSTVRAEGPIGTGTAPGDPSAPATAENELRILAWRLRRRRSNASRTRRLPASPPMNRNRTCSRFDRSPGSRKVRRRVGRPFGRTLRRRDHNMRMILHRCSANTAQSRTKLDEPPRILYIGRLSVQRNAKHRFETPYCAAGRSFRRVCT